MSYQDDDTRLRDMLDYAVKAVDTIKGKDRADLDDDYILAAAIERFVEIIGEAANRVSISKKDQFPEIYWSQIVGMRNRLIHGYIAVDYDVLWDVVHDDLPELISKLKKIIG